MDVQKLWDFSSHLPLGYEQFALLHNSLHALQNEGHYSQMFFWGILKGIHEDYFIAYGVIKDAIKDRRFHYSLNCREWGLLPKSKQKWRDIALNMAEGFQGDPFAKLSIEENEVKEEDRLAAIVHLICEEAQIVPMGYFVKRPDGLVTFNENFKGLNERESKKLQSFCHYRNPWQRWNTNMVTKQFYDYSVDFPDAIDLDIPYGCWVLIADRNEAVVKSLYWPGAVFFQNLRSADCGWIYVGDGKKNLDLCFMI